MTTFFAEVRVYRNPDHNYYSVNVEIPAADMTTAIQVLGAWRAGLAANRKYDTGIDEAIYQSKRRGVQYLTLREAAILLRDNLFE